MSSELGDGSSQSGPGGGPRHALWIQLVAVVLLLACAAPYWSSTKDDAYIFMTCARNARDGQGLGLNEGEPVYCISSMAWFALSWLLLHFSDDPYFILRLVGQASAVLALLVMLAFVARRHRLPLIGLAGALMFACDPALARWSVVGMEAPLATLLCALVFWTAHCQLHREGRFDWVPTVIAAGVLVRLEFVFLGLFWAIITLGRLLLGPRSHVLRQVRSLLISAVPLFLVCVAIGAFGLLEFGQPMPSTVAAKSGQPLTTAYMRLLLSRVLGSAIGPSLVLLGGFAAVCLRRGLRQLFRCCDGVDALMAAWVIGLPVVWICTGAGPGTRYMCPLTPFIGILAVRLVEIAIRPAADVPVRPSASRGRSVAWVGVVASCLASQLAVNYLIYIPHAEMTREKNRVLLQVCNWVNQKLPPEAVIASYDVGYLAWYTQNRIIGTDGLNLPLDRVRFIQSHGINALLQREQADYAYAPDGSIFGYLPREAHTLDVDEVHATKVAEWTRVYPQRFYNGRIKPCRMWRLTYSTGEDR
ncbi:MAG TPA: hypothetical protein VMZ31_20690 [Phycisphaerae bacterium]|nr:hypothetical protein [Phycisphaerae bacterium]